MTDTVPIPADPDGLDDQPSGRVGDAPPAASSRWAGTDAPRGDEYDERWAHLATRGFDIHGEADLVSSFRPTSVLDAGCGTGRVAIELAHRGIEVTGIDLDDHMLAAARRKAPDLRWVHGDLAAIDLAGPAGPEPTFDAVVAAGNVLIYLASGTEAVVIGELARHLRPGGHLIAGFQVRDEQFDLATYDGWCRAQDLELAARYSTWDGDPYDSTAGYAVSVHRR